MPTAVVSSPAHDLLVSLAQLMRANPGLLIIVASALMFIVLERLFPFDPRQRLLREGFFTDLIGYALIQGYALGLLIASLIRWIDRTFHLPFQGVFHGWPIWAQCGLFLVSHDLYIYAFHRLQHSNAYLWRIHEAHHSGHAVDWLSGTRSHALEILIDQTVEFAPIVLLRAAPEVIVFKAVIDAVWGMYIHSNLRIRTGRLQYIINGPEMHRVHHAKGLPRIDVNFATKFAIWDWLFGSAYLPERREFEYGLEDPAPFPRGFLAQQVYAFRSSKTR